MAQALTSPSSPTPTASGCRCASPVRSNATASGRILIVDETRRTGGVSEQIAAALLDAGYSGRASRVTALDSFVPLGATANLVLPGESEIGAAARGLLRR